MGPEFWSIKRDSKLQKCSERVSNSCTDETDGCCAVIPCAYCLTWDPYSYDPEYALAEFAINEWIGTIAGVPWRAYWQRNYETGECEFHVEVDGNEVFLGTCYDKSCRDSSGSVSTTIRGIDGELTWERYEHRPLAYRKDYDSGCTVHFCGDCECTCQCLCVTIASETETLATGELCDTSYACDAPVWAGTLGTYDISIELDHDEYDRCILRVSVDGVEYDPVLAPGCTEITAVVNLPDSKTLTAVCRICNCNQDCPCPCCPDCWRRIAGSVGGILVAVAGEGGTDCGKPPGEGADIEQEISFDCIDDGTGSNQYPVLASLSMTVRLYCDADQDSWKVQYKSDATDQAWADADDVVFECPACEGVESGGMTTSTITFVAYDKCSTSGGDIIFPFTITITVTVECV